MSVMGTTDSTILDLFCGIGYSYPCMVVGWAEIGIDVSPAVRATRESEGAVNGPFSDVWDGLRDSSLVPEHSVLVASPECQSFSTAGNGSGRAVLEELERLVAEGVYRLDQPELEAALDHLPPSAALSLVPLVYIYRFRPRRVLLEQVPAVMPLWRAYAEAMDTLGYISRVEVLSAEQFGVPQVRKRAVLVASNDTSFVNLPAPTHARWDSRKMRPNEQDLAAGLLPPVTLGEALNLGDRTEPLEEAKPHRFSEAMALVPEGGNWRDLPDDVARKVMGAAYDNNGGGRTSYFRKLSRDRPAPTIVGSTGSKSTLLWHPIESRPLTLVEAAKLQTFPDPENIAFHGNASQKMLMVGNAVPVELAHRLLLELITGTDVDEQLRREDEGSAGRRYAGHGTPEHADEADRANNHPLKS